MKRALFLTLAMSVIAVAAGQIKINVLADMPPGTYTCTPDTSGSSTSSSSGSSTSSSSGSTGSSSGGTASSTYWIYYNGTFSWPGDFSWSLTANYKDTSGVPLSGAYDIKATLTGQWGGWLPYAQNFSFDVSPYNTFTIAIKPNGAAEQFQLFFVKVGDVNLPDSCTIHASEWSQYGPAPKQGAWGVYNIPFSRLCLGTGQVGGTTVYKFAVQENSGNVDTFFVDNVGLVKQ